LIELRWLVQVWQIVIVQLKKKLRNSKFFPTRNDSNLKNKKFRTLPAVQRLKVKRGKGFLDFFKKVAIFVSEESLHLFHVSTLALTETRYKPNNLHEITKKANKKTLF